MRANSVLSDDYPIDHSEVPADEPVYKLPDRDELTRLAVNLARNCGYAVFPVKEDKRPATVHGFKEATRDPAEIMRLFRHPAAALIGVATGEASGVDVLDIDVKHNAARSWARAAEPRIPPTRIYGTRSGGFHFYLRHAPGVGCTNSKLARGIDTRGDGGYAIYWFAAGMWSYDDHPPATWPEWLLAALTRPPVPVPAPAVRRYAGNGGQPQAMIRRALDRLASAAEGHRHDALRGAACTLGGLMDAAGLPASEAEALLLDAVLRAGGNRVDRTNAVSTIRWGLKRGGMSPLVERAA